jgi:sec-independent protein translocase protein TatC
MPMPKSSSGEMPFLDHLEELRWRIIYSLAALVVGIGIGFAVTIKFDLLQILQLPVLPYLRGNHLVYTHPGDTFSVLMQMAFVVGIAVAIPVIAYQAWSFLAPALHKHEKKVVVPVLGVATLLFIAGVALAYFLVLPMTLKFLFGLEATTLTPMITVSEYFGFVTSLCLAFGAVFEVPIILVAGVALGIVTPQQLAKFRRFAVVIAWAGAAIITPGDLFTTTLALAIPLYLLYEASIIVSFVIFRRKQRRREALDAEQGEVPA